MQRLPILMFLAIGAWAWRDEITYRTKPSSKGQVKSDVFKAVSFANSQDQLGRRKTLDCVNTEEDRAGSTIDIGGVSPDNDRQQMRDFLYEGDQLLGLSPQDESDVSKEVRLQALGVLCNKLKKVENIKTLPALEEYMKVASGFGIIRRQYEGKTEQGWARVAVDNALSLYDGSDYETYRKHPDDVQDEVGGIKFRTELKYARTVFGAANHFFNIYVMTWMPDMEGFIHSHGESACSFKFMTEAPGFVQQGFQNTSVPSRPMGCNSVAFQDNEDHFAMTCDGAPEATLQDMTMTTVTSEGNARRGQVFYIQDDMGVHRFDNSESTAGFTVNVYYPSYEKTWLFSTIESGQIQHFEIGKMTKFKTVSEWLDKHGRTAPYALMKAWREPTVTTSDIAEFHGDMPPDTEVAIGEPIDIETNPVS